MDIEAVRTILTELDLDGYHQATKQKPPIDDVWPSSLEDAFIEAVQIFAPVGQKKYQVVEKHNGSSTTELIGRNDIISRFIFMKTRQYRARKQVSSHIQVWAHCKKPPSSREMPMIEFEQLQIMFRHFYSRTTSDLKPSKKRVRRVVSASNVSVSHSAPPRCSLGIHSETSSMSSTATAAANVRKRSPPWVGSSPSKRCRRVVSEMPPLSSGLFRDYSDDLSDAPTLDANTLQFHCNSGLHGVTFDMCTTTNTPLAAEQMFPQNTPLSAHSAIFASPLDAAMSSRQCMYNLGIAVPASASAVAFTAASIAELADLDGGFATPDIVSKERMANVATLAPNSLFAELPKSVLSADVISAFASAVGTLEDVKYQEPPFSGDIASISTYTSHVSDAMAGTYGSGRPSNVMLDNCAAIPSVGDTYALRLSPHLSSLPENSTSAANKHRLPELSTILDTDGVSIASANVVASSAGLSVADFCANTQVCGKKLSRVKDIADKNATNSEPACLDESVSCVGLLSVANGTRGYSSTCRPGARVETASGCTEPLVDAGLDNGTGTEWMERFGSLVSAQYCNPSVLTAKSGNMSPQPSNSSHSSNDCDSSAVDWYAMFSQYLHSIS
ncbi:hypothetical protein COEREDRAFT_6465 [Coemansia reversa NRRL 1564]|uniref:TEA domain-containing protein n=1 Tax=Coemansia reversa (strain ATCC 12441 / NRRL 1564) TaxID=763665 RepID=A0A2G5BIE1_COERN|nr:hypothetical protein COEREDRAFT_6465 [Coemansia reversa NRRL 1564]|eukprot:PIA18765.1 hypothetical protein COEREDRAFT_6465 [Coemansia reversa NRRL 1564]